MKSTPKMLSKIPAYLLCLLSFLFMLRAAGVIDKSIGLYDDALWDFIPAAHLIRADSLVHAQEIRVLGFPLPIASSPYSGAWKIWALAPILMFFRISPLLVLTLNILFGIIYLLALYWALLAVVNRTWASLVFLIPFVDTNYLLTVPTDNGIFIFQYIFIGLAVGALLRYLAKSETKFYWMTWFFCGCILAQKLTAIPIVITLLCFTVAPAVRMFVRSWGERKVSSVVKTHLLIPAACLVIPLLPHLYYFYREGFADLFASTAEGQRTPYFATLVKIVTFFGSLFDGADWYQRLTLDPVAKTAVTFPALVITGLTLCASSFIVYLVSNKNRPSGKYAAICTGLVVCSFLAYPLFRGLTRPWHLYVITPFFICCCVTCGAHLFSFLPAGRQKYATGVRMALGALVAAGALAGAVHGEAMLGRLEAKKGICVTSTAYNDAYAMIAASHVKKVYSLTYSLASPIYVFSEGSVQAVDLAWTRLSPEKMNELFQEVSAHPEVGIVYRYCACRDVEGDWIRWLNHEPDIVEVIRKVQSEDAAVKVSRVRDGRQTEFVLITRANR